MAAVRGRASTAARCSRRELVEDSPPRRPGRASLLDVGVSAREETLSKPGVVEQVCMAYVFRSRVGRIEHGYHLVQPLTRHHRSSRAKKRGPERARPRSCTAVTVGTIASRVRITQHAFHALATSSGRFDERHKPAPASVSGMAPA